VQKYSNVSIENVTPFFRPLASVIVVFSSPSQQTDLLEAVITDFVGLAILLWLDETD
jgi:hypothetical protein